MSESEREDIRQQLAETLGEREVAKALTEARWGVRQILLAKNEQNCSMIANYFIVNKRITFFLLQEKEEALEEV